MAKVIKIKKGLDINIVGKPQEVEVHAQPSTTYGVVPDHYPGLLPKLEVKVGDSVLAGTPVLFHKSFPEIKIVSPVSGKVIAINRGDKRKILSVEIAPEASIEYAPFSVETKGKSREELLGLLLSSGMFALLRQRPYDYLPNPTIIPRDIFVTANVTAPLTPKAQALFGDRVEDMQAAIDLLAKLTTGKVYVGIPAGSGFKLSNCEVVEVTGPHPAGNVGVLINHTAPVNKGDTVWTVSASELVIIGKFLRTGKTDFSKKVGIAGECVATRGIANVICGANVAELVKDKLVNDSAKKRIIDGDVLTGTMLTDEYTFMSPFSKVISVIPEGDDTHEMFGWAAPGFNKYSVSRSYPAFLMGKKEFSFDTRIRGGRRALIVSGEYDKVFPMDIYPEYLVRAIVSFDIDKMEERGIYEVAPEDFALCEFVDTSKLELQYLVRRALDMLYKEMN